MTPQEQINPDLVRKCAEVTEPDFTWKIDVNDVYCFVSTERKQGVRLFDIFGNSSQREALQMALMKEGWVFSCFVANDPTDEWMAYRNNPEEQVVLDESFPLLLLRAASLQFNIPMFVGGKGE